MDLMYYILSPFSWLLNFFYGFFQSYGIALILFAVVVKLILFPLHIKGKKSMIQMNLLNGKMQQLQRQYAKDRQRYELELTKLYEKEHVNPMGGCLWSLLPMFILIPLYAIIRQPLKYLMGLTVEQIELVARTVDWNTAAVAHGWIKEAADFTNIGYNQLYLASLVNESNLTNVTAALGEGTRVFAMNFNFLGLDLSLMPTWQIWDHLTWPYIGALLLILVSVLSGVLMSRITMKTNQMNTEKNEQAEKTNRTMMLVTPIMSLWIGFIMPVAMCLYWVAQNLLSMVQEVIAGRMLKKDYEAARIAAAEQARQDKEDEKRRKEEARLERARRLEEEKKNKSKKKGAQKKEAEPGVDKSASREGLRAYARGRAYDPNRFGGVTPYHDPNGPASGQAGEETEQEPDKTPAALTAPEQPEDVSPEETVQTGEMEEEEE